MNTVHNMKQVEKLEMIQAGKLIKCFDKDLDRYIHYYIIEIRAKYSQLLKQWYADVVYIELVNLELCNFHKIETLDSFVKMLGWYQDVEFAELPKNHPQHIMNVLGKL